MLWASKKRHHSVTTAGKCSRTTMFDGVFRLFSLCMPGFSQTCEAIAATTKKLQKTAIVAEYLKSCSVDQAAISSVFLSGRAFPAWEETTLQFGGTLLWRIVTELSGQNDAALTAAYRKHRR